MSALTAITGLHLALRASGAPALADDTQRAQGAYRSITPVEMNADLADLAHYLDDPDLDLAATMRQLAREAKLAVDSYLGLSVQVIADGHALTLTAFETSAGAEPIQTSVLLRLTPVATDSGNVAPALSVILYAAKPGAFIDLAADFDWLNEGRLGPAILDQHLHVTPAEAERQSLRAMSTINQAIGALIGSGHTPEHAHRELEALAQRAGVDRATAARQLLEGLDNQS